MLRFALANVKCWRCAWRARSIHSVVIASDSQLEVDLADGMDGMRFARRCERAVVTAYRELRRGGTDDMSAFQSCTTLYRIHHPEASLSEARRLVAEWIDHHVIKEDAGPAPGCAC